MLAWEATGSIRATDWIPYAVGSTLLLAVVLVSGVAVQPGRLPLVATVLLLLFAGWSLTSAIWAPSAALARNDGLLALLYALVFLIPLLTLRGRLDRLAASAFAVGALTGLALLTALWLREKGDPELLYYGGRLDFPITYWNGQAAMTLIGFWPAIALAARRDAPVLVRALGLGGATTMLALWLGTQSKGGGVALALSAIVVFAVSPLRLRLLVPTAVVAAFGAVVAVPLTEPFRTEGDAFQSAVRHAGSVTLAAAGAAALVGVVYALADRRLHLPDGVHRALGVAAAVLAAGSVAAGVAWFVVEVDHPVASAERRWNEFKQLGSEDGATSHFSQLGSNRYDFWRVAWNEFERHPVVGVGSFGWRDAYLIHRESLETPQRSHSLEMDALSETGIVGFLLIVAAGLTALVAVGLAARRSVTAAGALGTGVYFMIHTGGDWVWTIPAIGIPAMLFVGIGASRESRTQLSSRAGVPIGIGVALVALVAFAPPWLSSKLVERAYDAGSLTAAADDLRWARRFDPLAIEPLIAESSLADPPANLAPLRKAVARQPRTAELHYLLGLAYLELGRKAQARAELRVARALSPRDEAIRNALAEARG